MARLHRKKSQDEKRKKRQTKSNDSGDTSPDSEGAVSSSSTAVQAGIVKKKAPSIQRRDASEARAKSAPKGKVGRWIQQSGQFLREAKLEMKKVAWPSKKQTLGSTVVVLILVCAIAAFLGLADMVLAGIVRWVLQ
jgi:preprotein translocase subunit SecE